ncbi:hypothetical protein [Nocardioides sp. TF02-7]|uniref:hypothetical protein n=1 Tax=Nocardioides sp. TF02-7 TaxID=2917724 RepID=UPI001F061153|nr:hypothetical protein [Nocardioides sp. TF02-7]UMG94356.1 hypothetical protein MF408_10335 [Nocardioides sp. TF02-7]
MTRIKRPFAAAGAAVLLALSLSACGGAPTDASKSEFCEVINDDSALGDLDFENPDEEAFVDAIKEQAEKIEEVGTPEDIPDDAREGFEIQLEAINDLDADDIDFESDEDPLADQLSDDEKDKVEAFTEYETETCADEGTEEGIE